MAEEAGTTTVTAAALPEGAVPNQEYVDKVTSTQLGDVNPVLQPSGPQRPEGVPEQFWDAEKGTIRAEELAKSYAELRAKMDGKPADEKPAEDAPDAEAGKAKGVKIERPDGDKEKPEGDPEVPPLTAAVDAMAKAYAETGEVSEDHIKAVEELGLPRNVIDTYMAGVKALEAQMAAEVYRVAGGEEKFAAAQSWAAERLSDADLAYYNANIDQPDKRIQTVEWLMAKYANARPSEGSLVEGKPTTAAAGDVFESVAEMIQAQADPRYKTSESFRKEVAEKVLRSRRAGTIQSQAQFYSRT